MQWVQVRAEPPPSCAALLMPLLLTPSQWVPLRGRGGQLVREMAEEEAAALAAEEEGGPSFSAGCLVDVES